MALRNGRMALFHVAWISGAIWIGARDLARYEIAGESLIAYPLNPPVVSSVEPVQQLTPIPSTFDVPTFTTTEYITVTKYNDPTPVPYVHGGLSSHNPYANSSFVQGAIPYFVPFFRSSYAQTLTHALSWFGNHPITKTMYQAIASLISFLLYLWSVIPGGKQGLNTLAVALFLYALQFAYFWDPLARWLSKFFRRRGNNPPPSNDSGSSPPPPSPPPPSGGRPDGHGDDSTSDSPKPPKSPSSTEAQTTPGNTESTGAQNTGPVTAGEQSCLDKLTEARAIIAARDEALALQQQTTSARNKAYGKSLREHASRITELEARIRVSDRERNADNQSHRSEINRLQTQNDTTASDLEARIAEIERLKEAHEAQIKELTAEHNNAPSQQSEIVSGTAENANSPEERQESERQIRELQQEVQSLRSTIGQQQTEHAQEINEAVARACAQAWGELTTTKKRLEQSVQTVADLQRQSKGPRGGLFAPPSPRVTALEKEVATLQEALSKQKDEEAAAAKEHERVSLEVQNDQQRALKECNNRVEALESTNAGLTQQNEALVEQENAAKQAEEKANTKAEALQGQVDSLQHSLSLAGAGNEAAARLQQEIVGLTQRLKDTKEALDARENELQQARDVNATAARQQQEDAATIQSLRESAAQLTSHISGLQQDLVQARSAHEADVMQHRQQRDDDSARMQDLTSALQDANKNTEKLQNELKQVQHRNGLLLQEGQKLQIALNASQNLQTALDASQKLNQDYKKEGNARQKAHDSLKQAYDEQAQRCAAEKLALEEQAQKILHHEKQNAEGLRNSVRNLQDKISKLEDENSQARQQISILQNEAQSSPDKQMNDANAVPSPTDDKMEDTDAPPSPSKDEPMGDANPTTQPTPFSNPPKFPPPGSTTASPLASPVHSPGGRKILIPRTTRPKSPKKDPTGVTATTPRSSIAPLSNMFDMRSSHFPTPNVFNTVNGALSNAPALPLNPNFSTIAPGHSQNPAAPGTPLDPALGGIAPPAIPGAADTPVTPRDQERAEARAKDAESRRQLQHEHRKKEAEDLARLHHEEAKKEAEDLEHRQQREHEERKKEAQRIKQEIAREELGNFDGVYQGDDSANAAQARANDGNEDTNMAGVAPSNLVVGSREEHAYLRSMTDNAEGHHDTLYRRHNYRSPDTMDETDSPIYYSDFVAGSDAEISFLHHSMPANEDGRFDDLYRGNNYKAPDDFDEFGEPIWR